MPKRFLEHLEKRKIKNIVAGLDAFNQPYTRRVFIGENAGLERFLSNIQLDGISSIVASDLISKLEKFGELPDRPQYHALGALLDAVLELGHVPTDDKKFFATIIVKYSLIRDLNYVKKLRTDYRLQELEVKEGLVKEFKLSEKCLITIRELDIFLKAPNQGNEQRAWKTFNFFIETLRQVAVDYDISSLFNNVLEIQGKISKIKEHPDNIESINLNDSKTLLDTIATEYRENLIPKIKEIRRIATKLEKKMSQGHSIGPIQSKFIPILKEYYNIILSGGAIGGYAPYLVTWEDPQVLRSLWVQKRKAVSMAISVKEIIKNEKVLPSDVKQKLLTLNKKITEFKDICEKEEEDKLEEKICLIGKKYAELEISIRDFFQYIIMR